MAPSAEISKDNHRVNFPLEITDYPYTVLPQVECANSVNDLYDQLRFVAEKIGTLEKYADMYSSIDKNETPDRLNKRYREVNQELDESLDTIKREINNLNCIDTTEFSENSSKQYKRFLSQIEDTMSNLVNYIDVLSSIAEGQDIDESKFVNLRLGREDLKDSISRAKNRGDELGKSLSRDIEIEAEKLKDDVKKSNYGIVPPIPEPPFGDCPVCQTADSMNLISEIGLTRCSECKTEFLRNLLTWEVTHGDQEIKNHSLTPTAWKEMYDRGLNKPSDIKEFAEASNKSVSRLKWGVTSIVGIQLFVAIPIGLSGDFALAIIFIIASIAILPAIIEYSRMPVRR